MTPRSLTANERKVRCYTKAFPLHLHSSHMGFAKRKLFATAVCRAYRKQQRHLAAPQDGQGCRPRFFQFNFGKRQHFKQPQDIFSCVCRYRLIPISAVYLSSSNQSQIYSQRITVLMQELGAKEPGSLGSLGCCCQAVLRYLPLTGLSASLPRSPHSDTNLAEPCLFICCIFMAEIYTVFKWLV